MVPKYSMMGPFRGHMCIKSSPFSPGSSCNLSSQYIIQDHMATHYKKLLSAKAAVDSSAPKSLHTSIKYRDQQRKDRLVKAVERYKREIMRILSTPSFNARSISADQQKLPLSDKSYLHLAFVEKGCAITKREHLSYIPYQKSYSRIPSPVLAARETIHEIVQQASSQTPAVRPIWWKLSSPYRPSHLHVMGSNRKMTFQDSYKKTYSGDLLDKHSDWFTEKKQPFTPQILKASSQSSLSKYRYYNPPHKKMSHCRGRQPLKSAAAYSQKPSKFYSSLEEGHLRSHPDYSTWQLLKDHELRFIKPQIPHSPSSQLQEKEEELQYLQFLQEVTDDILIRSCYHKEALDVLLQMHMRSRRHDLDEVKMRKLFQDLKEDLNSSTNQLDPSISYNGIISQ